MPLYARGFSFYDEIISHCFFRVHRGVVRGLSSFGFRVFADRKRPREPFFFAVAVGCERAERDHSKCSGKRGGGGEVVSYILKGLCATV